MGVAQQHPIWEIVICSFALHLVPSASELFALLYELSSKAIWLIVIAPHKKPEVRRNPLCWMWLTIDQRWLGMDTVGHIALGRSREARGSGQRQTFWHRAGSRQVRSAGSAEMSVLILQDSLAIVSHNPDLRVRVQYVQ